VVVSSGGGVWCMATANLKRNPRRCTRLSKSEFCKASNSKEKCSFDFSFLISLIRTTVPCATHAT
jgi:hypothetical protein